MLIKDFNTLPTLPFLKSSEVKVSDMADSIQWAETKFIIPAISEGLYMSLDTAYNVNNPALSPEEDRLLKACQKAILYLACYNYMPKKNIIISKLGIKSANTSELTRLFKWEFQEGLRVMMIDGYNAIEELLRMLERYKDDYPQWESSSSYTTYLGCFVKNAATLNRYFFIDSSRVTYQRLRPLLERFQVQKVKTTLGDDYYTELLNEQLSGTLSAANETILEFVSQAIVSYAISAATTELELTFDERGITMFSEKSSGDSEQKRSAAPLSSLQRLELQQFTNAENAIRSLRNYLYQNISAYPTFQNSSVYNPTNTNTISPDEFEGASVNL
jgi:hypothetical protein